MNETQPIPAPLDDPSTMILPPQPTTASVLRGTPRLVLHIVWVLLVGGWLLYLFGFRDVAALRTQTFICSAFITTPEPGDLFTACTTAVLISESIGHIVFFVCALLLFLRKPDELMAVMSSIMLLLFSAGISTVTLGLAGSDETRPLARLMLGAGLWMTAAMLLLFPDGRFRPRWGWAVAAAYAVWLFSWWVVPALDVMRNLNPASFLTIALPFSVPTVIIWHNYRHHYTPTQQQQTKWVVLGVVGTLVIYLAFVSAALIILNTLSGTTVGLVLYIITVAGRWVGIILIPVTIIFAIARYRLWDADLLIGRALVTGGLTAVLAAVFVGAVLVVQRVALFLTGGEQSSLALAAASLAVAVLFNPARERLRRFIDSRLFPAASPPIPPARSRTPTQDGKEESTADVLSTETVDSVVRTHRDGLAGERFADYTLNALIGRGGMAEVYRARQSSLDRDVAVKILAPGLSDDEQFRARFEREGRTLAALNHPNIVRVFSAGEHAGIFYIAMEFIEGETLAAMLARVKAFTPEQAVPLLRGVAAALDYIHERGVIHRDVKPQNIMLQQQTWHSDGAPRPVLMDFGIARLEAAHTALTGGAGALGTLDYIAPEQILDTSHVDGRADQYALGVVAWQMLTGRLPFREESAAAVIMSHLQKPAPDPRAFAPHLSSRTALTLMRALAKDPARRFDTVSEFVDNLM
jgi:serine/threonine-protein kinase